MRVLVGKPGSHFSLQPWAEAPSVHLFLKQKVLGVEMPVGSQTGHTGFRVQRNLRNTVTHFLVAQKHGQAPSHLQTVLYLPGSA